MKKYIKPTMDGQIFAANEFVSACGDNNVVYNFECDAPAGQLWYYPNYRVVAGESFDITKAGQAVKLGDGYHPCDQGLHEVQSTSPFYWGFVDYYEGYKNEHNVTYTQYGQTKTETVIVWRGPYQNNGHANPNLDMRSWTTAKS